MAEEFKIPENHCGHIVQVAVNGAPISHRYMTLDDCPYCNGPDDLIADPGSYWARIKAAMAKWRKVPEDDTPDIPPLL